MTDPVNRCPPALFAFLFLLLLAPAAHAQTGQIAGTVVDSASGQTLPGVSVVVAGTQRGASTGADGTYVISDVEPGTYMLRASFVGYATEEIPGVEVTAGDSTIVDFVMQSQTTELEEVVVVGYGEQEAGDVTGAVSSIDGAELDRIPTTSATQALQGQVAGVQIVPEAARRARARRCAFAASARSTTPRRSSSWTGC